jgi:hypothetical protein
MARYSADKRFVIARLECNRRTPDFELVVGTDESVVPKSKPGRRGLSQETSMIIRFIPALALAFGTIAGAALAQNTGTMSGPTSENHMNGQNGQGCMSGQNHMSGGTMSGGPENTMSGGNHMAGGAMANGSMSGGDHMSSHHMTNPDCRTDQTAQPKH